MIRKTTILVPIRYPLTDQGARTLAAAGRLAQEHAPADLRVLHVNLLQNGHTTRTQELTDAISSTLDDVDAVVTTRKGFLLEEVILEEASQINADVVVVGANQQAFWRKLLGRLLGNGTEVVSILRDRTANDIEVMEVDGGSDTPTAQSV